jgi:hypothetical protein
MYENNTKYVGYFKSGEPHGKGIYHWRTGETFEGEFDYGWLKPGGIHISPEGIVVAQPQKRTWHKTYMEEEIAAEKEKSAITMENLQKPMREILLRDLFKTFACQGSSHREGTPEWYHCGH